MEQEHKKMMSCLNKIDIFESNLAYLLISGIINLEKSKQLGFNSDYVRKLLEKHKKLAENPYVEYYHDEKTGTTAMQTESGKLLILPYTPHSVGKQIKQKRANVPFISEKERPRL